MRRTRIYAIWSGMHYRIYNKNSKSYPHYGGRGIKLLWTSFGEFYRDMGGSYKDNLTIERIDVNGNYCKQNCRWIPRYEQANNKTTNVKFNGESMSKAERRLGLNRGTIWDRIHGQNWTIEKAFAEKKYPSFKRKKIKHTLEHIAKRTASMRKTRYGK